MPGLIRVKINGKECEAEKGEYILEVARRNKIFIPGLCHHEALSGLGCCRLCVVEVNEEGKPRVVVSCVYPLDKDCEVYTESEKIKRVRRNILAMLRGRAPQSSRIASLCEMYGAPDDTRFSFSPAAADNSAAAGGAADPGAALDAAKNRMLTSCILCGLCAEACARLGSGAISSVGRGVNKKISTPYDEASPDCIGCGSCAAVCPTGAVECTEQDGIRVIWGRAFELVRCENCGTPFATKEEIARAMTESGSEQPGAETLLCENCRRGKSSGVLAAVFGDRVSR
ncbi:MAG: (2Fe-2S)-binding protein [Treponema sp.]|jgi:predicted molibdopterin-dependent oxidoreductase YjgC|nr:(2Fe-2S)-binding protein [Treponema sp.]